MAYNRFSRRKKKKKAESENNGMGLKDRRKEGIEQIIIITGQHSGSKASVEFHHVLDPKAGTHCVLHKRVPMLTNGCLGKSDWPTRFRG